MNVPSYEALLDKETRIKVIRELCENVNKALNSQMSVEEGSGTSVEAEVGKYYRYADPVTSLVVTLPQVSGTSQPSNISFFLTTGSNPDIKFESDADVYLSGESTFSDDTSYYITATYDGAEWVVNVSIATFQSPPPQHNYVDLGLPSGTKWATMNVGATSPTDCGNYYMYGMGSKTYDSSDTPYTGTENPLDLSKDTARQVWGGQWHMPTKTQIQELIDNTTWQTTSQDGVWGMLFTAQNGNSIFLPNSGFYLRGELKYPWLTLCWSSTPSEENVGNYYTLTGGNNEGDAYCYTYDSLSSDGVVVRPVVG